MRRLVFPAILALVLTACNPGAREAEPFEGIWKSEGWGTFLLVQGGDVEIFEHTAGSCLSIAVGGARGIADALSFEGDRLVMRDSDREIRFDPIDVLPIACADAGQSSDPVYAATVLADTIEEQFAGSLDAGWDERRSDVLHRSISGGDELVDLLVELVAPLGGHIRLAAGDEIWPPLPLFAPPDGIELGGAGGYALGGVDGVGYLGLTRTGPFDSDPAESQRIAGRIADQVAVSDAVIIDLRASTGGVLADALVIASRFVPTSRSVGSLWARAGDGTVPAGEMTVTPVPTGTHPGPVFVLVGADTRGVGEVLAHLLGTLDIVTVIGLPTAGDPGPPLIRFLPNGWSVAVPNLVVRDPAGELIQAVVPDVAATDALAEALRRAAG